MKHLIIYALFAATVITGAAADTGTSSTVVRDGVTFTFMYNCDGSPCTRGRFVKGEPWIIPNSPTGTVTITSITPSGVSNSAVVNPYLEYVNGEPVGTKQGLLTMYDSYDASLNIMTQLPYTARAGESIYKIKSQTSGCGTRAIEPGCVTTAAVLTVLGTAPENDGATVFRPPFHGTWKPLYTTDNVMMDRLPQLPYSVGTPSNFDRWLAPQYSLLHKGFGELFRATIPHACQPSYAADQAKNLFDDMLTLFGTASEEQKRAGTYTIIQKGIDNYAVFKAGIAFGAGAGQQLGKKPPIAFFAAMYDDAELLADVRSIATDQFYQDKSFFQEDAQIRSVDGRMPVWGGLDDDFDNVHWYFTRLYPRLDRNGAAGDPYGYIDGPAGLVYPNTSETSDRNYLPVAGGPEIGFAFLQHLMPWLEYANNDWEILKWSDRIYDGYGIDGFSGGLWTTPDPCAPVASEDISGCSPYKLYSTGITGCSKYQVTWGPEDDDPTTCIKHNGDDMTDGRAPSLHGTKMEFNRLPTFVKAAWKLLRPCSDPTNPAYPCAGLGPEPDAGSAVDVTELVSGPAAAMTVCPNPSTGFVSVQGPSNTYKVFDRNGVLVTTIGKTGMLPGGMYVVVSPEGDAVQVLVTE